MADREQQSNANIGIVVDSSSAATAVMIHKLDSSIDVSQVFGAIDAGHSARTFYYRAYDFAVRRSEYNPTMVNDYATMNDAHIDAETKKHATEDYNEKTDYLKRSRVSLDQYAYAVEANLQNVLSNIPEQYRAQYLDGFLRHNDLIRTIDPKDNMAVYAINPDAEPVHSGQYIPEPALFGRADKAKVSNSK